MPNTKILDKIRALLAKAESTNFTEEAETYTAKAQELMSRYAIEESMLASAKKINLTIVSKTIGIAAPYTKMKAMLLNAVASANDCKVIGIGGTGGFERTVVYGTEADIDATEAIWTSLLMQQAHAMAPAEAEWKVTNDTRHHWYKESAKSFRQSFMLAYASRIAQRLAEAKTESVADYERETGTSTALVLRNKAQLVQDTFSDAHPNTRKSTARSSSASGASAGRAAANNANLGQRGVGQQKAVRA